MIIRKILISVEVQEKIFKKHDIQREEIEKVLVSEPYFFHARHKRYIAIGFIGKYITVVFDFDKGNAYVVTAYSSSQWQKELYLVKKWKK